jgi:hypothetical protein
VIVLKPPTKLIHHLVEDSGTACICAGSDVVNILIETATAGTVISYARLPFGEKTIDTAASGYMLGEPVFEGGWKFFESFRNDFPEY